MARLLVNDKWIDDVDLKGKSVAVVIEQLTDDGVLSDKVHEYGMKADGVVIMLGEVIGDQECLEVIEVPQVAEDEGVNEDSSSNPDAPGNQNKDDES
jgi:hypothetical protein